MTQLLPIDHLDAYVTSRTSWHMLAEHVVSKARWTETGKIGLRAVHGGFGTPHFGDDRQVFVKSSGVHHVQHGEEISTGFSTLRDAATLLNVAPGAPSEVFTASTACDLDQLLVVDAVSMQRLSEWFTFADNVLQTLRNEHANDNPSLVQLWPEHFDVAVDFANAANTTRANYGASPGDAAIPEPYIYVGPWDMTDKTDDPFWNQPWGTALTYSALCAAPDATVAALSFYAHGATRL